MTAVKKVEDIHLFRVAVKNMQTKVGAHLCVRPQGGQHRSPLQKFAVERSSLIKDVDYLKNKLIAES